MKMKTTLSRLESALVVVGLTLISVFSLGSVASALRTWDARAAVTAPTLEPSRDLTGLLEIPRLRLQAAIAEGDDPVTLMTAVGHLPDTSVPWLGGNTALAGHRDQLLRGLRYIQKGDLIRLRTSHGTFSYLVESTKIVGPSDVEVVGSTESAQLTLVTCYPFSYFGRAPQRFVVIAVPASSP